MSATVSATDITDAVLERVVRVLEDDGVVCFPTDTLYGVAVNPFSPRAMERLFAVKGRDPGKPILLLVDSISMVRTVAVPNSTFDAVAEAFWPGPITLVTQARPDVPEQVTAGTHKVGLRWPNAAVAVQLIRAFGSPITGTSANLSGQAAARSAEDVIVQLGNSVDIVIDGGILQISPASTVLDVSREPPILLREGPIKYEDLAVSLDFDIERRRP